MGKSNTDFEKLTADLAAAKQAAHEAAAMGGDGGTANMDHVILQGVRWSAGLRSALAAAGVTGRRTVTRFGRRACVSLGFGAGGQGSSNTRACEAASGLLAARGWDAWVFYLTD